jgi:hypothetical protein
MLLAGCANSSLGSLSSGPAPPPKAVVVTDFVFGTDVAAIDRSFTARLERKIGAFPTFERKQRTNERVNDEIVATIVATLREAGLDAQPGSEVSLSLKDDAVSVSGTLRAADPAAGKKNLVGFGSGRGGVIADMNMIRVSGGGKRPLLTFAVDAGKRVAVPAGKTAAGFNAAIAASLTAAKAAPEKLSPDVEAQVRSLGRAIGDEIVAFAKEQGWLTAPETAAEPAAADEKPVKLPPAKPAV